MTLRPLVFTAGVLGVLAVLIACGGGAAGSNPPPETSAAPTRTVAATNAPLGVDPGTLSFSLLGAQTFQVTESGYSGSYRLASSNTQVATVASAVTATAGLTPVAVTAIEAGSATITVTDSQGQSASVAVVVTLTPVTVSLRNRAP